jgi:hypothetical protein
VASTCGLTLAAAAAETVKSGSTGGALGSTRLLGESYKKHDVSLSLAI